MLIWYYRLLNQHSMVCFWDKAVYNQFRLRQQAAEQEAATRVTVEGMILGTLPMQADATQDAA